MNLRVPTPYSTFNQPPAQPAPNDAPPPAGKPVAVVNTQERYTLLVSTDQGSFTVPVPPSGNLSLGRAETCDVQVRDDSVSRSHAMIRNGEGLSIEDLGSANGTLVSGRRIAAGERVLLEVGAVVEMGKIVVAVQPAESNGASEVMRAAPSVPATSGVELNDDLMKDLYRMVEMVAPTSINVLLLGETGVGKEVLAATVHERSARANKPFLKLNCAALPESLLESELFGHEKGSFTGALQTKLGLFESADSGTVFLDELGEMPLATQSKLLRVLESGEVMRVGSVKTQKIDIRLIAATNRDLRARIDEGAFRADLYFRINGFSMTIPPLRERKDDIMALTKYFLDAARRRFGTKPAVLSPSAVQMLLTHSWPGNIRELRNIIDRAALLCTDGVVEATDLGIRTRPASNPVPAAAPSRGRMPVVTLQSEEIAQDPDSTEVRAIPVKRLRAEMGALEKARILSALEECGGNQSRTAKVLGMARRTLLVRLDEYGVTRPRKNTGSNGA